MYSLVHLLFRAVLCLFCPFVHMFSFCLTSRRLNEVEMREEEDEVEEEEEEKENVRLYLFVTQCILCIFLGI